MGIEEKTIAARLNAAHLANISSVQWFVKNENNTITLMAKLPDDADISQLVQSAFLYFAITPKMDGGKILLDENQAVAIAKAGAKGPAFDTVGPYRYSDTFKGR